MEGRRLSEMKWNGLWHYTTAGGNVAEAASIFCVGRDANKLHLTLCYLADTGPGLSDINPLSMY